MAIEPVLIKPAHLWKFLVGAVKKPDQKVLPATITLIKGLKILANLFNPRHGCERIASPIKAEVRPGNDQFIDIGSAELLEKAWNIVINSVPLKIVSTDQFVKIGEAAEI